MRNKGLNYTLPPEKTKILILGTFPSEESLRRQEYYSNPKNRFWKVIFGVLEEEDPINYCCRKEILNRYGICLWDIIESCEREGSLDKNINNFIPNNLDKFSSSITSTFLVNGAGIRKKFKLDDYDILKQCINRMNFLPSTSSGNAHYSTEKLIKEWKKYIKPDKH